MSVTSEILNNEVKVMIDGNFDIGCYEDFNAVVTQNMGGQRVFVIDLSRTTYLDSSALGMLLLLREKVGGDTSRMRLINVNESVLKVLKMAKFDMLFSIN